MAMGVKTKIYIKLISMLLGAIIPALKEAAGKTPNQADDMAISLLESALEMLTGGELDELFK